jgi:cytochrome c oxidase subunit 2
MTKTLADLFLPQAASSLARDVDSLFLRVLILSVIIAAAVFIPLLFFLVRYRKGSPASRDNIIDTSLALEAGWTLAALLLSALAFFWAAKIYMAMQREPPGKALNISVTAKQWMWKFEHPSGKGEINELHVPIGRIVRLVMTSQDVIHSFYVPALRLKHDILPQQFTSLWFRADKPGRYHIFCAQYCGTLHSAMTGVLDVVSEEDYLRFTGSSGDNPHNEAGARLFHELGCGGCHATDDASRSRISNGPPLVGVFGSTVHFGDGTRRYADEAYFQDSILNPAKEVVSGYSPLMPSYQGRITNEDMERLVAYLRSLGRSASQ